MVIFSGRLCDHLSTILLDPFLHFWSFGFKFVLHECIHELETRFDQGLAGILFGPYHGIFLPALIYLLFPFALVCQAMIRLPQLQYPFLMQLEKTIDLCITALGNLRSRNTWLLMVTEPCPNSLSEGT